MTPGCTVADDAGAQVGSAEAVVANASEAATASPAMRLFRMQARTSSTGRTCAKRNVGPRSELARTEGRNMNIWIDLTNSPHVLVMRPVIQTLRARGDDVLVTARDFAQTLGLLERFQLDHT